MPCVHGKEIYALHPYTRRDESMRDSSPEVAAPCWRVRSCKMKLARLVETGETSKCRPSPTQNRPETGETSSDLRIKSPTVRGIGSSPELDFSRPGKPTDNARVESFNGRLRQECLNANWFLSLDDAKAKISAWRTYYNESSTPLRARLGNANRIRPSMRAAGRIDDPRGAGSSYF